MLKKFNKMRWIYWKLKQVDPIKWLVRINYIPIVSWKWGSFLNVLYIILIWHWKMLMLFWCEDNEISNLIEDNLLWYLCLLVLENLIDVFLLNTFATLPRFNLISVNQIFHRLWIVLLIVPHESPWVEIKNISLQFKNQPIRWNKMTS